MSKHVTRSTVNEQQYSAPAFSKSGFNMSHRRYSSYILGRLHCSGYQDLMPGDKISGKNDGTFTFNNIVTPMMPKVDVQQYNFMMMFRALDRSFERAFAPSKNNDMSARWQAPCFSIRQIVSNIFQLLSDFVPSQPLADLKSIINSAGGIYSFNLLLSDVLTDSPDIRESIGRVGYYLSNFFSSTSSPLNVYFKNFYLDDVLVDMSANVRVKFGLDSDNISQAFSDDSLVSDVAYQIYDCLLSPFVGRYSYLAELKYNYLRPKDIYNLVNHTNNSISYTFETFIGVFDDTQLNEYPIRAMYVVWYEYFRNVDLEPVSDSLPYWRDFGNESLLVDIDYLPMLVLRPRPWYEDMFVSAQIDDLSRHVYAPIIYNSQSDQVSYHDSPLSNLDANYDSRGTSPGEPGSKNPSGYTIGWFDQVSGVERSLYCPVPTNINDVLSSVDKSFSDVYGLDLNTLRQSQQLERYLKRNYLFGDEYNDRMLAHYNSRVSDLRINRPELISQSFNSSDNKQEIANQNNGVSNAGDRTATATISASGDNYSAFSEEFGILLHIITFMPTSCYDGTHPQLYCSHVVDYPLPEFATNNEEFGRKTEIASSGLKLSDDAINMFGRYPAYHAWRSRVDEVGGMFLDELQDATFRRFWGFGDDSIPKLNYQFIHCRPSLQMFRNTNVYDSQIYGDVVHECYVERVLPTPVETI